MKRSINSRFTKQIPRREQIHQLCGPAITLVERLAGALQAMDPEARCSVQMAYDFAVLSLFLLRSSIDKSEQDVALAGLQGAMLGFDSLAATNLSPTGFDLACKARDAINEVIATYSFTPGLYIEVKS